MNPSIYRQVYGGTVNCGNLEEVFALCNSDNAPPGYCGEAMSVSNVIEVCGGKDKGFYFCDNIGFKPITDRSFGYDENSRRGGCKSALCR